MIRYLLGIAAVLVLLGGWLAVQRAARTAARRSRLGPVRAERSDCGGCDTGCETARPAGLYSKGAGHRME